MTKTQAQRSGRMSMKEKEAEAETSSPGIEPTSTSINTGSHL